MQCEKLMAFRGSRVLQARSPQYHIKNDRKRWRQGEDIRRTIKVTDGARHCHERLDRDKGLRDSSPSLDIVPVCEPAALAMAASDKF